ALKTSFPEGKALSTTKYANVLNKTYKDTVEQVSKQLPGASTVGIFSKIEGESQSALTLIIVDEEGSVGSIPGAMGSLKSAICGLTEAAGASCSVCRIFLLNPDV
ncbi:hypothetical protein C0992_007882, partial [Termitomyces sp. T32_za158]